MVLIEMRPERYRSISPQSPFSIFRFITIF
jgi:hypothetical protein